MSELLERVEALRIPPSRWQAPSDWKDWYHFVLLEPDTGVRILANLNLTGGGSAELQTTLIAHLPTGAGAPPRSFGSTVSHDGAQVTALPLRIDAPDAHLEFRQGRFQVRLADPSAGLAIELDAFAQAQPLLVTEASPFGSGFIGWGLLPGLAAEGELRVCGEAIAIGHRWFCYQDHNFGRFRWGEDIGWEWLTAHARTEQGEAITAILDIRTDRAHRRLGLAYLFICLNGALVKVFVGLSLRVKWHWSSKPVLPLRLPGAMATLAGDRAVRQPVAVEIHAADEQDRFSLRMAVDAFVELVVPDNQARQYTRIGETSGSAELALQRQDHRITAQGLAYGEYTH